MQRKPAKLGVVAEGSEDPPAADQREPEIEVGVA